MKLKVNFVLLMVLGLFLAMPAQAEEDGVMQSLNDARLEGQLWSAYALNRHLSTFDIDVEVTAGTAVLTGTVEESVQRDLAEEIALGTRGIDKVDNRLEVGDYPADRAVADRDDKRTFGDRVSDATTTATVKSKLLWNRNTSGLAINVSTEGGEVTLEGEADSPASRELAERLAANTEGVSSVNNRINVTGRTGARGAAAEDARGVGDAVSDGWITTKVRSTLVFSRDVPGTAISVETKDGVVMLEGEVSSEAEKRRAVALAGDIQGVKKVDAGQLVVADGS